MERKVEGIIYVEPSKDKRGSYVPYCRYDGHSGVIEEERSEICEVRKCRHYKRLYL